MRDFSSLDADPADAWGAVDEGDGPQSKPSRSPLFWVGIGAVMLLGVFFLGRLTSSPSKSTPLKNQSLGKSETPQKKQTNTPPSPEQAAPVAPRRPSARQDAPAPRRVMDFSMGFAVKKRPAVERSEPVDARPEPAEDRPEPRVRRVVVRRRVIRKRRRGRSSLAGCQAPSAGMRTIRLRARGMSLSKIMIRVQGQALSPNDKGCVQIPSSARTMMLAYKPDVTAYHLCQVKLSSKRSSIRFKLVDANIAPPADGDCSR